MLGNLVYQDVLKDSLGVFGAALILGTVYLLGMLFIFTRDIAAEFARLMNDFAEWRQKRAALKLALADESRQRRAEAAKQKAAAALSTPKAPTLPAPPPGTSKKILVVKTEDPFAESVKPATNPAVKPATGTAPCPRPQANL